MDYMSELIAFQNDVFRNKMSIFTDVNNSKIAPGLRVFSFGINQLTMTEQVLILNIVKDFEDFNEVHDPRGWHENGVIAVPQVNCNVIWTIDYYDENYRTLIENPVTEKKPVKRVLTTVLGPLLYSP